MEARVTNIQRFCMHDGPGIRTVVFFAGCPLRCRWCHNPETQISRPQIYYDEKKCIRCGACGSCINGAHTFAPDHLYFRKVCTACGQCTIHCSTGALSPVSSLMKTSDILKEVYKDMAFYGKIGGMTLSGGEPMGQPEAALALLREAKQAGISTAIETSGYFDESYISELCRYTDVLLWDFKDSDDLRHTANTGVSNRKILSNLRQADRFDVTIILRCILLKNINYNPEHLEKIRALSQSLIHCSRVDFLPYHPMGDSKNRLLGMKNDFHDKKYMISDAELAFAYDYMKK